ncbi:hypothetical protein Tco_0908955 [Tanacetum coccineum]|uniref:Reverse transcriptase Ty1/copia-type domain-containing protein n=1 Tax=Tanacetum coccineum TaxID=301880 RepID=A0ABQ5CNL7_9ASTR
MLFMVSNRHLMLGIKVASLPKGSILSQSRYIGNLLNRARITNKMVEDIRIDAKVKYTLTDGDLLPDPISGKHLEEIHALWTQFGKKWDKISTLQTVETSSHFLVTMSKFSKDDVKIYPDDVKVTNSREARRRFTG